MKNVEFKAELRDPQIARAVARSLNAHAVATLEQTDTYYRTFNGRLKKRETVHADGGEPEPVEYIHYERDNRTRPKISAFQIMTDEEFRERFGAAPLPEWLVVRKTRAVYIRDHARIHLDQVEGLGAFIEFEVLVSKSNNIAKAHETVEELRAAFGPVMGEPISVGYSDLMADQNDPANADPSV
jgi:predicted adenylyl cyclase CyaB